MFLAAEKERAEDLAKLLPKGQDKSFGIATVIALLDDLRREI